jgi:subtilase family serine protease
VVCANADSTAVLVEMNEGNNTMCGTDQVTIPTPDLVTSAISTSTKTIRRGSTLWLTNAILNQGGTTAGSFVVGFHLSADQSYGGADDVAFSKTRTISSLKPGATSSTWTSVTVPSTTPPGLYYVCASADVGAAVTETNEENNARCTTVTIQVTQ